MGWVEAAAEAGATGPDQERHRRCWFADAPRVDREPPFRFVPPCDGECIGRVGRDLAALQRRVGHGDEHAYDGFRPVERRAERVRRRYSGTSRTRLTRASIAARRSGGTRAARNASTRSGGPSSSSATACWYSTPIFTTAPISALEFTCGTLIS